MPRKKVVDQSQSQSPRSAGSPRRQPQANASVSLPAVGKGGRQRKASTESAGFSQSEASTAAPPAGVSLEDAAHVSAMLEDTLDMASGEAMGNLTSVHERGGGGGEEWQIQSPEEIIADVKRYVHSRKPWRQELDDAFLERRKERERQDRLDRGSHILLPDNRVRVMDEELSSRIRSNILDEEEPAPQTLQPAANRSEAGKAGKSKLPKKVRNPWYMDPKKDWYNMKDKSDNQEDRCDIPYANEIYGIPKDPKKDDDADSKKEKSTFQKETQTTIEAYMQYMKGHRLPHFLQ